MGKGSTGGNEMIKTILIALLCIIGFVALLAVVLFALAVRGLDIYDKRRSRK